MSTISAISEMPEAISTSQLCATLGLSKRRFLELRQRGVFPQPTAYTIQSRRPIYFPAIVQECMEVRRRNVGINDEIVFFHVRSAGPVGRRPTTARRPRQTTPSTRASGSAEFSGYVAALAALGLNANSATVARVIHELFPAGTTGQDEGTLVRAVYQQIRMRNSGDNLGR